MERDIHRTSALKNQHYQEQTKDVGRIVRKHEGLVRRIAFRMHSRVSSFIELDDLLQSGLEGLVDAAQKYSAVEGASFESYASIRIKGSILDSEILIIFSISLRKILIFEVFRYEIMDFNLNSRPLDT